MTDENKETATDTTAAPQGDEGAPPERDAAAEEQPAPERKKERVDEDGLPLDREATIDDVRSRSGLHGRVALGCAIFVVLLIAAFWAIRAGMGG